jgi:sodium/potassium-transporting ATPase subunit alpha
MIIICVGTDVLPALSMVREMPESDLLLRKPRDRKKDRLADWKLIFHAYFFIGILESLTAMTGCVFSLLLIIDSMVFIPRGYSCRAFYFGFQRNGVPFSALWLKYGGYDVDPAIIAELTARAQSICQLELVPRYILFFFSDVSADFINLVIMQWFNLLASRTRRLSLFQQNPLGGPKTRNLYLFPAMVMALVIAWYVSVIGQALQN